MVNDFQHVFHRQPPQRNGTYQNSLIFQRQMVSLAFKRTRQREIIAGIEFGVGENLEIDMRDVFLGTYPHHRFMVPPINPTLFTKFVVKLVGN